MKWSTHHREITMLILVLLLTASPIHGQDDEERGIDLGFNFISITQRSNSLTLAGNHTFTKIENSNRWGFDLGFALYYVFSPRFELRTNPCIGFEEDQLMYSRLGSTEKLLFGLTLFKLPTHGILKISKQVPFGIMLGASPDFSISKHEEDPYDKLKLKGFNVKVEAGINYTMHLPWFTVCPEVRYSKSLTDVAGDSRTEYGQAISDFYRNGFVFALYFRTTIYQPLW